MDSRPRVLVIPSWYPTAANPLVGSFYQEQGALFLQRYDIRVLFGLGQAIRYRDALRRYQWWPRPGRARIWPATDGFILSPPPVIGFEFAYRSKDEPEALAATIDAYRQMLGRLVNEGWQPDLILAHCAELAGFVATPLAKELGVPWIISEGQVFILSRYGEHRRQLMIDALNNATRVLPVSYHQMRAMISHGIHRPMQVIGNFIDEELFRYVEPRRTPTRFRILAVTYPSVYKDPDTFFKAIGIMLARGQRDIEVTVIGNNSWGDLSKANTDEYEKLAAKYNAREVCRFLTHASRDEMPAHYASCDVFVSTSVAETYGVAVREAMAVGRPVVCTASGGVEDDLTPDTGIKVNIRDAEALADALIAVKTDAVRFDPCLIRQTIVTRHGRQAFLEQMSTIFDEVLRNPHGDSEVDGLI